MPTCGGRGPGAVPRPTAHQRHASAVSRLSPKPEAMTDCGPLRWDVTSPASRDCGSGRHPTPPTRGGVATGRPECEGTSVRLLLFSNCAAGVRKQPEWNACSNRSVNRRSRASAAPQVRSDGRETPGWRPGSSCRLLADGLEYRLWSTALGWDTWVRTGCGQTLRTRGPVEGIVSSRPAGGCPATGGISSRPLNGARREKDLTLQPPDWTGEEGLEHSNHRPVLLAESYVRSAAAAFPLGDLRESESSLRSDPGNRDRAPSFLWRETLEKPDNDSIVAHSKSLA